MAFSRGEIKRLVTKARLAGWGLNWQHCALQTYFVSHSYEAMYQGIRRCWRFGQTRPVRVHLISSEGAAGVLHNLQRKARQADQMFAQLIEHMHQGETVQRPELTSQKIEVPTWL